MGAFANVFIVAHLATLGDATAQHRSGRSGAGEVELRSRGFLVASESELSVAEEAVAKGHPHAFSLLGVSETARLVSSTGAQVLKNRLFTASSHIRDMVLLLQDLTNPMEMGLRKTLELSAADINGLDHKLVKPLSKV